MPRTLAAFQTKYPDVQKPALIAFNRHINGLRPHSMGGAWPSGPQGICEPDFPLAHWGGGGPVDTVRQKYTDAYQALADLCQYYYWLFDEKRPILCRCCGSGLHARLITATGCPAISNCRAPPQYHEPSYVKSTQNRPNQFKNRLSSGTVMVPQRHSGNTWIAFTISLRTPPPLPPRGGGGSLLWIPPF